MAILGINSFDFWGVYLSYPFFGSKIWSILRWRPKSLHPCFAGDAFQAANGCQRRPPRCWSWDVGMFMGCCDVGHGMLGCWSWVFRFGFGEIPMFVGHTSTDHFFWSKLARLVNRFQRKGEKTSLWLHTTTMSWLISRVHRMNSCSIMPFRIFVYLCNKLGRFFVFSVLPPMQYQSSHQTISHVHC